MKSLVKSTLERGSISGRQMKQVVLDSKTEKAVIEKPELLHKYGIGMDSVLAPTAGIPEQFAQTQLAGFVSTLTQKRSGSILFGEVYQGSWSDVSVVQWAVERTGAPQVYGDLANPSLTDYNTNAESRHVVRSEIGFTVTRLEEQRASKIGINAAATKRTAVGEALAIWQNDICFNGFDDGKNRTFGALNDPNLSSFITVAEGAKGSTEWRDKTFQEIKNDILMAAESLRALSGGRVDPDKDAICFAMSNSVRGYLAQATDFGVTVLQWIKDNYANWRVESAVEFNEVNGGENIFYLFAETIADDDLSTDDKRTFAQIIPAKIQNLGMKMELKGQTEDFTNATAGVICKRPFAVVRYSGV